MENLQRNPRHLRTVVVGVLGMALVAHAWSSEYRGQFLRVYADDSSAGSVLSVEESLDDMSVSIVLKPADDAAGWRGSWGQDVMTILGLKPQWVTSGGVAQQVMLDTTHWALSATGSLEAPKDAQFMYSYGQFGLGGNLGPAAPDLVQTLKSSGPVSLAITNGPPLPLAFDVAVWASFTAPVYAVPGSLGCASVACMGSANGKFVPGEIRLTFNLVASPVPEAGGGAMMALGLAAMGWLRRRQNKQAT